MDESAVMVVSCPPRLILEGTGWIFAKAVIENGYHVLYYVPSMDLAQKDFSQYAKTGITVTVNSRT